MKTRAAGLQTRGGRNETLRVGSIGAAECFFTSRCDLIDVAEEEVARSEELEAGVVMLVVVPAEKIIAPKARMSEVAKASGVVGLILCSSKVRLGERIVVGHARP